MEKLVCYDVACNCYVIQLQLYNEVCLRTQNRKNKRLQLDLIN